MNGKIFQVKVTKSYQAEHNINDERRQKKAQI